MKKILIILSCGIFVVACSKVVLPTASEPDAQRASQKWPGTTLDDLTQGKALYEQHCDGCHGLKRPSSESEKEWNKIVPEMARKAKIDNKTQDLILKYLVTMSELKQ